MSHSFLILHDYAGVGSEPNTDVGVGFDGVLDGLESRASDVL